MRKFNEQVLLHKYKQCIKVALKIIIHPKDLICAITKTKIKSMPLGRDNSPVLKHVADVASNYNIYW